MNNSNQLRLRFPSSAVSILNAALSFSATFCFFNAATLAADNTRYVIEDGCSVHSGPDASLYATQKLAKGATVEVYHETADGWSGIRPPVGSFDWVAAEAGHLLPGGKTMQIVGKPTPAWIGTYEPIARDALKWQIELKPTQKVVVVGEAIQPQQNAADRTWFKIQPPQGEFRWIQSDKLASKPLPVDELSNNRSSNVVAATGRSGNFASRENDEMSQELGAVVQAGAIQRTNSSSNNYPSVARKTGSQNIAPIPDANAMRSDLPNTAELPAPVNKSTADNMPSNKPQSQDSSPRSLLNGSGQASGDNIVESFNSDDPSSGIIVGEEYFDGQIIDGQVFDGEMIEGQIIDGEVFEGEVVYENGSTCCDSCGVANGCNCGNGSNMDSMQGFSNPKLRVHPIGKILGLVGLSIAEAEIVQPESNCTTCGPGTPTMSFGANPPSPSPRFSERFQHLPRPGRRMRATFGSSWIGDSGYSDSEFASDASYGNSNLIGSRPWHSPAMSGAGVSGAAPPRLNANPVSSISNIQSRTNSDSRKPFGSTDISLVSNEDLDSLHFSTPEIQQAMLELSSIVARPMDQWSLIGPMNQAKNWIDNANDTIARGEARLLLDRIERFEGLRQRSMVAAGTMNSRSVTPGLSASAPIAYAGFQRPVSGIDMPGSTPSPNAPPLDQTRNPDGTPASDASGWLVEVFSQQPGQPEFALTDDAGGLIAYVVASPGMNLRRYLKQPVGIYGVKGYLPNLSARQITAERIVRVR
ncbi:MAG: hypothetical protein NTW52_09890 [Planctomycetota bacterium]|nr:hypothetical protein [Planctomycetota bacterium]